MASPPSKRPPRPDSSGPPGEAKRRRLSLTDRPPATTSSANLLSLANSFADPSELRLPPAAALPATGESIARSRGERGGEMRARLALGDYTGALDLAEEIEAEGIDDALDREATRCAEGCRATLIRMYSARIGPLERAPVVIVPRDQLRWLSLDHRAGFVLSLVDGTSSVEEILDVSGMPELAALRILAELVSKRVIAFR